MAIFGSITAANISSTAIAKLSALRTALQACSDYHTWLSAYSATDLQTAGFSAPDAQALLSAFADADELNVLYKGGTLGSYTLPYNFSASQRKLSVLTDPLGG